MNIVAFNSSPRDNRTSKTELILQKFLEGAGRAGAVTETLYLRHYHLKHCLGCFGCWLGNRGKCEQRDDMSEELFNRFLGADLAVLATPLYNFNMNARLKIFIERTVPMLDPALTDSEGWARHLFRLEKVPHIVALSVCAFPEAYGFQALSLNMRMLFGTNLIAEIYRHSSEFLAIPAFAPQVEEVLAAVDRAGEEVVRQGHVSPETMEALTRDLAPREDLIEMANRFWQKEMAREEAPDINSGDEDSISKWV